MRLRRLEFYEEDVQEIDAILTSFLDRAQAKCILMVDKEGFLVTKKGFTKSFDTRSLAALTAGAFASTREMARILGETEFTELFHQGKNEHIHVSLVADRALLVTVFDDRTTIGMVRLYASEVTEKVAECLSRADERNKDRAPQQLAADFEVAAEQRLNEFFKDL
jgi:predicted regulator of Ras-like GTPase activity (Roadblock/LC7/MglB family)